MVRVASVWDGFHDIFPTWSLVSSIPRRSASRATRHMVTSWNSWRLRRLAAACIAFITECVTGSFRREGLASFFLSAVIRSASRHSSSSLNQRGEYARLARLRCDKIDGIDRAVCPAQRQYWTKKETQRHVRDREGLNACRATERHVGTFVRCKCCPGCGLQCCGLHEGARPCGPRTHRPWCM